MRRAAPKCVACFRDKVEYSDLIQQRGSAAFCLRLLLLSRQLLFLRVSAPTNPSLYRLADMRMAN